MNEEEKLRFQQEIDAMTTEEIQLIIEDQRELYAPEELRMLVEELEYRSDLDPEFRADAFTALPQEEQELPENAPPLPFANLL